MSGLQIFSPILWVAFSLGWWFASLHRSFKIWCSSICLFLLLSCVPLSYPRNHYQFQHPEVFPLFSSKGFIVSGFTFRSLICFELIFVFGVREGSIHSFACGYGVFPTSFVEDTILSPLCSPVTLVEDHLTICAKIYFWALYFVSLVYMSVIILVSYCFVCCSFIVCLKTGGPQHFFSLSRSFWSFLLIFLLSFYSLFHSFLF